MFEIRFEDHIKAGEDLEFILIMPAIPRIGEALQFHPETINQKLFTHPFYKDKLYDPDFDIFIPARVVDVTYYADIKTEKVTGNKSQRIVICVDIEFNLLPTEGES